MHRKYLENGILIKKFWQESNSFLLYYIFFLIICKNVVPSSRRIPLAELFTRSNIQWATKFLVKLDQRFHFIEEINNLDVRKQVSSKSPIVHLYSFLDKDQIIKVGGQLAQSNILSEQ